MLGYIVAKACKKFDLVHQVISPRERVGSGDETNMRTPRTQLVSPDPFPCFLVKGFGGLVVYRPIQQGIAACMSPVEALATGIRMRSSHQREELIKRSSDQLINDTAYYFESL